MKRLYDYVVVGGGLAGLYSAYYLSRRGSVALIAQGAIEDSNSYHAQGGIAAVSAPGDTAEEHYDDTIVAGVYLNDPEAVRVLTEEAPARIREVVALGMVFDKGSDGRTALGLEGGHHHHRILHAGGDDTGHRISDFMIGRVRSLSSITLYEHHEALDLIVRDGVCRGIMVYDRTAHVVEPFLSGSVILATGGCGALFSPTTNPPSALGDGCALALEAGAELRDMEFMQFHPTGLYTETDHSFLISEAVRGEGAILLDEADRPFMKGRHPLADLAPRDIVAREIFREMKRSGATHVRLSLRHLDPERIRKRFPTISAYLDGIGIDITKEIPVAPAAHYTVGGIRTDLVGRTSLPRLYAVGEAASTGVMGANRLASNSLIECLVYGRRVADSAEGGPRSYDDLPDAVTPALDRERCLRWYEEEGRGLEKQTARFMTTHCGIIRRADELRELIAFVRREEEALAPLADRNIYARMTLRRLRLSRLIAEAALSREESRGCHYREDFTATRPQGKVYHTLIAGDGTIRQEPVREEHPAL